MYIQTIENQDYSTVNSRCLEHDGCVVDLGCWLWDWSQFFIGKKRIIGVDPFESPIEGAELFKGVISNSDGFEKIAFDEYASCLSNIKMIKKEDSSLSEIEVESLCWKSFCEKFDIDKISVLKINIEGSEYRLIESMDKKDFEKIDQIAISFHHFLNYDHYPNTVKCIKKIQDAGFDVIEVNIPWCWYLCENKKC
jgi:FkbM family methyltransferase